MAKKNKNKKLPKHKRRPAGPKLAETADKYEMYQRAVQAPDVDVEFFQRVYQETFARSPKVLREDFCGTFAVCCEWVKAGEDHTAVGVDLDPEPIAWGKEHNLAPLEDEHKARVEILQADVMDVDVAPADIVAAQNFSYCIFKTRDALRAYFQAAHRALESEGVLILDLFGGYESMEDEREEITAYKGFDYVWDQHTFDPVTHFGTYKIHFRFRDRSRMDDAFVYDWRLWTIPEVREVLIEAGFDRADVYWEETDDDSGEGNGVFTKTEQGECDPAWNAYIVGVKS